MIFSWFKNRRRRQLSARPFPAEWSEAIRDNVEHVSWLSAEESAKLERWMKIFTAEKYWEGCNGLAITEEIKATIAAQAGILVLGLDDCFYEHLQTILVYPEIVWRPDPVPKGGVVSEEPTGRLGEAWRGGPVTLVWPHVLEGGRRLSPGRNVVFHEFAHVLDLEDQFFDGTPPLDSAEFYQQWEARVTIEYQALVQAARQGRFSVIDTYGATNLAEFFAVSTECFFENPQQLARHHAEWFELLKRFYRLNPLDWYSTDDD